MRKAVRTATFASCGLVLGLAFVVSGVAGCNASKGDADHAGHEHGDAANVAAKTADEGHDHAGHEHGDAANVAAKTSDEGHDHAGHDHGDAAGSAEKAKIAQKRCPVMDEEIDPEFHTMHDGRKIFFCCEECIDTFKKSPAKYLAKLDSGA